MSGLEGLQHARRREPSTFNKSGEGDTVHVDRSGYISAKQKIEDLMLAGQKLGELRKARFDFEAGQPLDFDFVDPTRRLEYDLADATMDMLGNEYKRQQIELQKQQMEDENDQTDNGNSGGDPVGDPTGNPEETPST